MSKFCVMPWIGLEIGNNGTLRPCCAWRHDEILADTRPFNINTHSIGEYHASSVLGDIRSRLLQGDQIDGCAKCYHEESIGIRSLRIRKNREFEYVDVETDDTLKSVDIKLSNLCNQKCVICNPVASSMLAAENRDLFPNLMANYKQADFNWYKNDERWNELKQIAHTVKHLDFFGGEPWLIKKQWEFVKYLVDNNLAKDISINYATNGSIFDAHWFEEYFPKFKKVSVLFSADGIGDTFEYNRMPAKWSVFLNTIRQSKDYKEKGHITWMGIAYTVSAYSIHNVIPSLEYYRGLGVPVWFSLVNDPEYKAGVLPSSIRDTIKQEIISGWRNDFLLTDRIGPEYFITELERDAESKWRTEFVKRTTRRDQYRGVNFNNILKGGIDEKQL